MKPALFALVLLCLVAGLASAGEPITIGEIVTIQSKILGEERTILISTPRNYDRTDEPYPVLYMTDGYAHLTHTRGTVDFLANNGRMPQVIIVAVVNTDRTRDLSPTHVATRTAGGQVREMPTSGGASVFWISSKPSSSHTSTHTSVPNPSASLPATRLVGSSRSTPSLPDRRCLTRFSRSARASTGTRISRSARPKIFLTAAMS